ncbi:hypothetical protein KHP62_00330 [Rhodobacteraceae bacterium NNCM2]|nr:hypothetical protein [Coraliihabitans acroporae]
MPVRSLSRALVLAAIMVTPPPARALEFGPGEKLVYIKCGRCHVIGPSNRMGGIGSTPKFVVMKNWEDWEDRMRAFYALNPHPAFTQIEGITEPFPEHLPSPIAPITLTEAELEQIIEYTRGLEPADLGGEVR